MPKIYPEGIKQKALRFRKQGFTYSEILRMLKQPIPKSTLASWFKNIILSDEAKVRIISKMKGSGVIGRAVAWQNARKKRADLLEKIYKNVDLEIKEIDNLTARLCLAMLYLGEGGKTGELFRFGNSDAKIISIFLKLLRQAFLIEENRLRAYVQCRADQNTRDLQNYWSNIAFIPLGQFGKPVIDKRTVGIPTKRMDYKGVFVIEYYSKALFFEVKSISDIIYNRLIL